MAMYRDAFRKDYAQNLQYIGTAIYNQLAIMDIMADG